MSLGLPDEGILLITNKSAMFAGYQNQQAIAIPPNSTYPSTSSILPPTVPPNNPDDARRSSASAPTAAPTGLNARSCVTCRRRKVKCDKKVPCSNCTKAQTQCVFPAPGRAPRRPRAGGKPISDREAELLKRLRRLEGVVEELSGQVDIENAKASPLSDHSSPHNNVESSGESTGKASKFRTNCMNEEQGTKKEWVARSFNMGLAPPKTAFTMEEGIGRLVLDSGKSQYVSNPFWAELSQEIAELRAMFDDDEEDTDGDSPIPPPSSITQPDHQSFVMGYSSADVDMKSLHPLPSQIPFYWTTFLENVMPLVKLLHVPTMGKIIKEVQHSLDNISKSTEALMFSIYFATITSMSNEEVCIFSCSSLECTPVTRAVADLWQGCYQFRRREGYFDKEVSVWYRTSSCQSRFSQYERNCDCSSICIILDLRS